MALSGTIEKQFHGSGSGYYFGLEWRVNSQSVASNSSNVTATVYIRTQGNGYTINSSAQKTVSVTINGTKYLGNCTVGIGTNSRKNLFSKTVDVPHNGDGNKTCDFACALDIEVSLSGRWYGKITHSGQGTFNKINLNTAPWWTSDDTHMTAYSQALKANTIIPENANEVVITSSTAWDNEQGGNLHFDIHRYVNGSHSAQIKWGGSSRDVTDYLANWGAGTVFKYEAKVHDGQGLWAPGSRWSWVYTKNRFSPATVGNIGSIGANQNALNFTAFTARNQGGLCNNNYHYRITSLTPGVNIYGTREHSENAQRDVHFTLGVKNNGGAVPTNPHWLDANEIKNYLASNGYNGNIRLRIESWNDYGSSGNADFNVWVDLRKDVPYTTIRHNSGWITHKGTNYYMPAHLPIDINWDAVSDPLGGTITYEVLYQIGDGGWIFLSDVGTATKYKANLATAIGNSAASNFRFIVRAKTTYGKKSESGGPRINLSSYSSPTIRITEITRNKSDAVIKGFVQVNSSISGGTPTSAIYSLNNGGNVSFLNAINSNNGSFTFTVSSLDSSKAYSLNLLASDSIRDALKAKGVTLAEGSASSNISVYIPAFSIRRNGIGVNAIPDGSAAMIVNGGLKVDGIPMNTIRRIGKRIFTVNGDANTYYPVVVSGFGNSTGFATNRISISRTYSWPAPDTWNTPTHRGGLTLTWRWAGDGTWGGNSREYTVEEFSETYTNMVAGMLNTTSGFIVWLRGGGAQYQIDNDYGSLLNIDVVLGNFTAVDNKVYNPRTNRDNVRNEILNYHCVRSNTLYDNGNRVLTEGSLANKGNDVRGKIPQITGDGVMEIGQYIDFHYGGSTSDFNARLEVDSNGYLRSNNILIGGGGLATGNIGLYGQDIKIHNKRALVGFNWGELWINYNGDFGQRTALRGKLDIEQSGNPLNLKGGPENHCWVGFYPRPDMNARGAWMGYGSSGTTSFTIASEIGPLDIFAPTGSIEFNVNSQSGCRMIIDRSWGGTAGSEACLRADKVDGWGFLGNTGNKFFRVYATGGSVGSYKPNKYDVTKYDTESLYNYVKDMNIYLYRTRSILKQTAEDYANDMIKTSGFHNEDRSFKTESFEINNMKFKELDSSLPQEDILKIRKEEIIAQFDLVQKEFKREDLMLGTMIHELPTEVVDYDTEGHDGKTVELYSYTTMAIGAIKHLQGIVDKLQNRITELEAKNNGDSNQR